MNLSATTTASSTPEFQRLHQQLAAMVGRFAKADGGHQTAIAGLTLFRRSAPGPQFHGVYEPALSLIAQGAKRVMVGDDTYDYDHVHCLVTSVDLPVISQVMRASGDEPYLGVVLDINPRRIRELMAEPGLPKPRPIPVGRGMAVNSLSVPILDAVVRLVRLLDTPQDIPVLGPLLEREILYRLLTGEQGMRLRHIAVADSQMHQVSKAIDWIRKNFAQPLRIEVLAQTVNMSASSLHHNFKAITGMSPLQYQKRLRLQEARRLMLAEMLDAAPAAHQVGYESPSQFCREYGRLFGAPPGRDIAQLRLDARAAYYVGRTIPRVPMGAQDVGATAQGVRAISS
jgi:AraC-like DNA-binding protein